MGYYDDDAYYQPEKFGLKIIGGLNEPDLCYEFNELVVWQHEDGRVFFAQDSGCSCPSPFEDYTSLEDLTPVTTESWEVFEKAVNEHGLPYHWHKREKPPVDKLAADRVELLAKVSRIV